MVSARVRANRANAKRSTGPKSVEGKSRVAQNAARYGLAVPVELDPALAPEIGLLSRAIAGEAADLVRQERARRIAEAQIDLVRIRRVRLHLLNDPNAQVRPMRAADLKRLSAASKREGRRHLRFLANALKALNKLPPGSTIEVDASLARRAPVTIEIDAPALDGFNYLASQLARLDRYERRALSRRRRAIREFDDLAQRGQGA